MTPPGSYTSAQPIEQLEKRKGGYFYLKIAAEVVNGFTNKRQTRLLCHVNRQLTFPCGLNHLGDGNFFIILSGKNLKMINKQAGDIVDFELEEDPNPLGVETPEVIEVVLQQDEDLKRAFEALTAGKKRSIIHQVSKIKDIDRQIQKTIVLLRESALPVKRIQK